jgi:hypothetical protein
MILSNVSWLFAYSVIWKYVDALIYYTCPFSIEQPLCMLMFLLYWWPVVLSIFHICTFMLLSPPSHAFFSVILLLLFLCSV